MAATRLGFGALLLLCSAITLLSLPHGAVAESESETIPDFSKMKVDFSKLKVKELQALMEERGVVCNGCAEKSDLVKRVRETFHLPLKSAEATATAGAGTKGADNREPIDESKLDELLKKMGGAGKGFKIFRPEDLKNMKPEDMRSTFGKEEL